MVRAGLGVTVLPELVCRHADPGIAFRELAESVAKRHIDMISRARDTPSPATAAFTDFFASCLTGKDGSLLTNI